MLRSLSLVPVVFFIILCSSVNASENMDLKIFVFGFDSECISDVQDRLLREMLMKRLRRMGFGVVPVMEIESVFRNRKPGKIRRLTEPDIREICKTCTADFAISGSIRKKDRRDGSNEISDKGMYLVNLRLYDRRENRTFEYERKSKGKKSLYNYYTGLCDEIAALVSGRTEKRKLFP